MSLSLLGHMLGNLQLVVEQELVDLLESFSHHFVVGALLEAEQENSLDQLVEDGGTHLYELKLVHLLGALLEVLLQSLVLGKVAPGQPISLQHVN
jgi:hypothetical protein